MCWLVLGGILLSFIFNEAFGIVKTFLSIKANTYDKRKHISIRKIEMCRPAPAAISGKDSSASSLSGIDRRESNMFKNLKLGQAIVLR